MYDVEAWAEIRRLGLSEGVAIKEIVRRTGVARNTVRAALRSSEPPGYVRPSKGSVVDAFEPEIRRLLMTDPRMAATVIAERIEWERGITVLKDRVRELRPLFVPADPSGRSTYRPGELAQWDLWFPERRIPVGFGQSAILPVIVGVSGFSRTIVAEMICSKQTHDVLDGHGACLVQLGGVPKLGVYDGEPAISSRRSGKVVYTQEFSRFRGTLAMGAYVCKPGDPEAKGMVERAIRYLTTSFLPGRTFSSPADFNVQLHDWIAARANVRLHATLRARPIDLIAEDRAAMRALPSPMPDTAWHATVRLGRDHWIRHATNDYSVHPRAVGRRVEIRADLENVVVTLAGEIVARHDRCWAKHHTITDPAHELAAKVMRTFELAIADDDQVEVRDLTVYDRLDGAAS
jgi:transposase